MRLRTRVAALVFAVIPLMAGFYFILRQGSGAVSVFLFLSGNNWLMAAVWKGRYQTMAIAGACWAFCAMIIALLADWHPFGVSWAILMPAWIILIVAQALVIYTEKPGEPVKEN